MARTPTSKTSAPQVSNLNSLANAAAKPMGSYDINADNGHGVLFSASITLASSGVAADGTIELWAITAGDNSGSPDVWDDGISPSTTSDIASSIKNAKRLDILDANANSQVVDANIDLTSIIGDSFSYVCVIVVNKSGAALPASGHAAYYQSIVYS